MGDNSCSDIPIDPSEREFPSDSTKWWNRKCDIKYDWIDIPESNEYLLDKLITSQFQLNCQDKKKCELQVDEQMKSLMQPECFDKDANDYLADTSIVVSAKCFDRQITIPGLESRPFYKTDLIYLVGIIDIFLVICFVIFIIYTDWQVRLQGQKFDDDHVQITDNAVCIKNLPDMDDFEDNEELVRSALWLHIQKVVEGEQKQIQILEGRNKSKNPEDIIAINFGFNKADPLQKLVKMQEYVKKKVLLQKRLQGNPSDEKRCGGCKKSRKQHIVDKIDQIEKNLEKCYSEYISLNKKRELVAAYVTFRSTEGKLRAINEFKNIGSCLTDCLRCCRLNCNKEGCSCYKCCCKFRYKTYEEKVFMDSWLDVKSAEDPSVILWENMGISVANSRFRTFLIVIVTLILLILCAVINLFGANADKEIAKVSPQVECDPDFKPTAEEALIDVKREAQDQLGEYYCFCFNQFNEGDRTGSYKFADGETHCYIWVQKYLAGQGLIYGVPLLVTALNTISRIILRSLTQMEGKHSETEQQYRSTINVMLISFMNMGIMVLLINMQLQHDLPVPVFKGRFDEFSVDWYRLVGSNMCIQLTLLVITNNVSNFVFALLGSFKRCLDRGCRCWGAWRTKKLTQEDYEKINTGDPVQWDYKFANLLTILFLTMPYGSGIPIMYIIAFVYFFVTYWVDKWLIFYNHRKPNEFGEKMTLKVLSNFKYAVFLHVLGALFMYSNNNILPQKSKSLYSFNNDAEYGEGTLENQIKSKYPDYEGQNEESVQSYQQISMERVVENDVLLSYFLIFVLIIALFIIDKLLFVQIRKCITNKSKKAMEALVVTEEDFAKELSHNERKFFWHEIKHNLTKIEAFDPDSMKEKVKKRLISRNFDPKDVKEGSIKVYRQIQKTLAKLDEAQKHEPTYDQGTVVGVLKTYDMLSNDKYLSIQSLEKALKMYEALKGKNIEIENLETDRPLQKE